MVGVGLIETIAQAKFYETSSSKPSYPMWDRLIRHSIRPEGDQGFLLPYQEYLEPTGDSVEDERRAQLLEEIAVPADPSHVRVFSYTAELAPNRYCALHAYSLLAVCA